MGQYGDLVNKQRLLLKAEEWSKGIKAIHGHSMSSLWYDNRPQDTEDGKKVIDTEFYSGLIQRKLADGGVVYFGNELKGEELVDAYIQHN